MSVLALTASHHEVDLSVVERLSAGAEDVGRTVLLRAEAVRGVVVLATCNRFELYADVAAEPDEATLRHARRWLARLVAEAAGVPEALAAESLSLRVGRAVAEHLFAVAAGLDSMAVGEREIAGQIQRALESARSDGLTSKDLERLFQAAARAAKKVASGTALGATGRSLVDVGLDVAGESVGDWTVAQTLLVGTGAYAGAAVAALRRRRVSSIEVYSGSGRAAAFAENHGIAAVAAGPDSLAEALARADLVVAASGRGNRARAAAGFLAARPDARPLTVLDLALGHDIEPAARDVAGVRFLDLASLQDHVPQADRQAVAQAQAIIDGAVAEFSAEQAARRADGAIAALVNEAERQIASQVALRLATLEGEESAVEADDAVAEGIRREVRRQVNQELHGRIAAQRAAALEVSLG